MLHNRMMDLHQIEHLNHVGFRQTSKCIVMHQMNLMQLPEWPKFLLGFSASMMVQACDHIHGTWQKLLFKMTRMLTFFSIYTYIQNTHITWLLVCISLQETTWESDLKLTQKTVAIFPFQNWDSYNPSTEYCKNTTPKENTVHSSEEN